MRSVLDVGSGDAEIPLPDYYAGWRRVRLDLDPSSKPDLLLDARKIGELPAAQFDAVYTSHNLEHFHRHEGRKVLAGCAHVLKPEGFIDIRVPDLGALMRAVVEKKMDIDDVAYQSDAGPILVRDVIYGFHVEIERSGSDFYAHKTGFTEKSLGNFIREFFPFVLSTAGGDYELLAVGFKQAPSRQSLSLLGVSADVVEKLVRS